MRSEEVSYCCRRPSGVPCPSDWGKKLPKTQATLLKRTIALGLGGAAAGGRDSGMRSG